MLDFGLRSIIFIILCIMLFIGKNYRGLLYNRLKYWFHRNNIQKVMLPDDDKETDKSPEWNPPEGKKDFSEASDGIHDRVHKGEDPPEDWNPEEDETFDLELGEHLHEIDGSRHVEKKKRRIPPDLKSGMIGALCGIVLDRLVRLIEKYLPQIIGLE